MQGRKNRAVFHFQKYLVIKNGSENVFDQPSAFLSAASML
jgi:hypothetical protein